MPELPEVETVVRTLRPAIVGRTVGRIRLLWGPLLRRGTPRELKALEGRTISAVERRGKMVLVEFEGGALLVFHLKMTGQLFVSNGDESPDKHLRLVIGFRDGGGELRFRDIRKFGFMLCIGGEEACSCPELGSLGPEPLETSPKAFARLFAGRGAAIKALLLDQTVVAGIGNIYADESLFDARIHPTTRAADLKGEDLERLGRSVRAILRRSIKAGGSTIRNYVDGEGRTGSFQNMHKVYGHEGEPCPVCGMAIERIRVAGRSSFFCPVCQKAPAERGAKVGETRQAKRQPKGRRRPN